MNGRNEPILARKDGLSALITNVQRFSTEDGPGIRTTVFFKGCPLSCPWCHNPEGLLSQRELVFYESRCIGCKECVKVCKHGALIPGGVGSDQCELCFQCVEACPSTARQVMGEEVTVETLVERVLRDRVFYEKSNGGVTASGGEAMIWAEFMAEFFRRLRQEKIHTALDTSAVIGGEKLARVLEATDLVLLDLKIMDPERHRQAIGALLPPILEHIREIAATNLPIILRVPIVPGFTDAPDNLRAIAELARTLKALIQVELLPFHQLGRPKYRQLGKTYTLTDLGTLSDEAMLEAKRVFTAAGLKAIIGGKE